MPGALAYRRPLPTVRARKRAFEAVEELVCALAGQRAQVRGFGLVVVDDEGLRAHEVSVRVRGAVAQRDRQGELGALVAEIPDHTTAERQFGGVVDWGGEFAVKGGEDIGVVAERVGKSARQGTGGVAEDGKAPAGVGGVEEERVVAVACDGVEDARAVKRAGDLAVDDAPPAEEVAHECFAVLREHGLRVKLHAPVVQAVDLECLDHAVLAAGVHRHAGDLFVDVQGVVAHYLDVLRNAGEDAFPRMGETRDEAVARLGCAGHRRAGK